MEFRAIHLQGARDHYHHKAKWSWFLMMAIGDMVLLQFALLFPVDLGWLDFTLYDWLLHALLVQTFCQFTGLAVYAVRYLSSEISNQSSAHSKGIPGGRLGLRREIENSESMGRRIETLPTFSRTCSFAWPVDQSDCASDRVARNLFEKVKTDLFNSDTTNLDYEPTCAVTQARKS